MVDIALTAKQDRISQGERWHCCWRGGFRGSGMCQPLLAHNTRVFFNSFAKLCMGHKKHHLSLLPQGWKGLSLIPFPLSELAVTLLGLGWLGAVLGVCWRAHLELYMLEKNCSWSYTLVYLTLGKKINVVLFQSSSEGCLVNPKISRSIYKCGSNTLMGDWSLILAKQNSK